MCEDHTNGPLWVLISAPVLSPPAHQDLVVVCGVDVRCHHDLPASVQRRVRSLNPVRIVGEQLQCTRGFDVVRVGLKNGRGGVGCLRGVVG